MVSSIIDIAILIFILILILLAYIYILDIDWIMDPEVITKATVIDKPVTAPAGTVQPQKGHIVQRTHPN